MIAVKTLDIPSALTRFWATDPELLQRFHIQAPATLAECVARSVADLQSVDPDTFQFYVIEDESGTPVGFFASEKSVYLTTFFVAPEFRRREHMSAIWDLISSHFPGEFYTAIHDRNTRAAKFYAKNGTEIRRADNVLVFRFRSIDQEYSHAS